MVLHEGLPGEDEGGDEIDDGYDDGESNAWGVHPNGLGISHCVGGGVDIIRESKCR